MKQIDQRYHTHVLGLAAVAATFLIVGAGSPYLLAQTDYSSPMPDTILTAPLPVDQQPVNTQPPSSSLIPSEPRIQQPGMIQPAPCVPQNGASPDGSASQPCPPGGQPGGQQQMGQPPSGQQFNLGPNGQRQPMPGSFNGRQQPVGQNPSMGQNGQGQPIMGASNDNQDQGNVSSQDFVDPKEIKNALNEITRMTTELNRLARKAKQMPEMTAKIDALRGQLGESKSAIVEATKSEDPSSARDAMQELWDSQPWDEINKIRLVVELPKELKMINTELKKLDKIVTNKTYANFGLDLAVLKDNLVKMREAYDAAVTAQQSGDSEEVMQAMDTFQSDGHPGEVSSVIMRLRDIQRLTKTIRDAEVQAQIKDVLQPIIESFNKGDFRNSRELMDDAFDELVKVSNAALRLQRRHLGNRADMVQRLGTLGDKLQAKIDKLTQEDEKKAAKDDASAPNDAIPANP